ncbi:hypothetical protein [Streptomyces sp. NPDC059071]|uniref:hypothetical protein n=1 Tax=unclassified Streptomyces TaxID=2593676 RepID=UPI003652EA54
MTMYGIRAVKTALAALAAGASLALTAPTASAGQLASDCWNAGRWYCNNVYGAPVYQSKFGGDIVGYMFTTTSWFECKADNGDYIGGPHPRRWVWTQADNGQWGYMRDIDIYSETNPLPNCPV